MHFRIVGRRLDSGFGVRRQAGPGRDQSEHPIIGLDGSRPDDAALRLRWWQGLDLDDAAGARQQETVRQQGTVRREDPRPRLRDINQTPHRLPGTLRQQAFLTRGIGDDGARSKGTGEQLAFGLQQFDFRLDQAAAIGIEIEQANHRNRQSQHIDGKNPTRQR